MALWILRLCLALLCLAGTRANAAVSSRDWKTPGDGLLSYDDVNQREWLDLTQSRLSMFAGSGFEQRFQNALSELAPGGMLEGFKPAKSVDLSALGISAGFVFGGDFPTNSGQLAYYLSM